MEKKTGLVRKSEMQSDEFRGEFGQVRVKSVMQFTPGVAPSESDFMAVVPKDFQRTNAIATP